MINVIIFHKILRGDVYMEKELSWQVVFSKCPTSINICVTRAKIPGGWLVAIQWSNVSGGSGGLTFVPDPDYKWATDN